MIVPRVFKSRQRKRKNISIVLSSHKKSLKLLRMQRFQGFLLLFSMKYSS